MNCRWCENRITVGATAKSSIERAAGEIRIVHEVNRGRAYKIYDALFEGLRYFTPDALKRELGFERATSLFGGLDGAKLLEMPGQIARVYETAGFLSTRVDLSFRQIGPDMTAIFTVDEGPQQTVARLTIAGAALFDDATLKGQIASKAGGPFYQPNIRKDIDRLESFYLNQGVRGTAVTAAASPAGASGLTMIGASRSASSGPDASASRPSLIAPSWPASSNTVASVVPLSAAAASCPPSKGGGTTSAAASCGARAPSAGTPASCPVALEVEPPQPASTPATATSTMPRGHRGGPCGE